ncbi:MAG: DUF4376 domain-containing protein [Thermodesulfobacteriota bacterium]
MFAYVKDGQLIKVSNEDNVEWEGVTIPHVSLLTPAERHAAGIYDFVHATQVPAYHRAGATTYTIDNVAGTVTEAAEHIPLPLEDVVATRKGELAAYRYQIETGGVTVGGSQVATDRESQAMIAGAKLFSDMNPAALVDWKTATGWVQIDAATITAIANAVGAHVQACFSAERAHSAALDALSTVEGVAAYDITTGWPV